MEATGGTVTRRQWEENKFFQRSIFAGIYKTVKSSEGAFGCFISDLLPVGIENFEEFQADDILVDSLRILSELLEKHYGRKAILLIDEYDVPLDKAFQKGYYDEMVSLIRNLLGNALKTNENLYFAVLTGCLRISRESIFTGLNNLKVHTISDVRYDEFFGFTDTDVDEMLDFYGLSSSKDMVWRFIEKADQNTKNEIEWLLNGESILKPIKEELTYQELAIPNREIRKLFVDLVKDWFEETTLADPGRINHFCAAFPKGDVSTIQDMLHDYLWDSISVRDTAVRTNRKENFYHGMMLGLLRSQENWLIQSNAETGEGYSDISVCTPERTGIVIELKYAHDGNLEAACEEALRQIEDRKYEEGLKRRGMKEIMKYGMAFCGKECMVVMV